MKNTIKTTLAATATLLAASTIHATDFDFEDPKGVNHIIFKLDAPLEFISGTGKGISGKATFEPEQPNALNGTIVLSAESLSVPNATMLKHMHGEDWMHVEKHPEVTFAIKEAALEPDGPNTFRGTLKSHLTMRGITKPVTAEVKLTHIEDGASKRGGGREGDLLVVRADFTISLEDFGIELNAAQKLKVSDTVELEVVLAGYES